jgi:hypothetical protein
MPLASDVTRKNLVQRNPKAPVYKPRCFTNTRKMLATRHLVGLRALSRPSWALPITPTPPSVLGVRWQSGSHMEENPAVIEREMWKSIQGRVKSPFKNAPGWDQKLASVSEAEAGSNTEFWRRAHY